MEQQEDACGGAQLSDKTSTLPRTVLVGGGFRQPCGVVLLVGCLEITDSLKLVSRWQEICWEIVSSFRIK